MTFVDRAHLHVFVLAAVVVVLSCAAPASAEGAGRARVGSEGDPVGAWPLGPGPDVVRTFDAPSTPYSAGHRGVDLAGARDQPVRAALPGSVTYAAPLAGRGVVVISHGATRTTYQPVTATVRVGDAVAAGDKIGRLDSVGSHCFPRACLHWGWIQGETYLDPLRLVGAGPIRLLPLWREMSSASPRQPPPAAGTGLPYRSWSPLLRVLRPFGAA
ncbi:MAG: M23 family metallopeptidase [Nocardioides sp.]